MNEQVYYRVGEAGSGDQRGFAVYEHWRAGNTMSTHRVTDVRRTAEEAEGDVPLVANGDPR